MDGPTSVPVTVVDLRRNTKPSRAQAILIRKRIFARVLLPTPLCPVGKTTRSLQTAKPGHQCERSVAACRNTRGSDEEGRRPITPLERVFHPAGTQLPEHARCGLLRRSLPQGVLVRRRWYTIQCPADAEQPGARTHGQHGFRCLSGCAQPIEQLNVVNFRAHALASRNKKRVGPNRLCSPGICRCIGDEASFPQAVCCNDVRTCSTASELHATARNRPGLLRAIDQSHQIRRSAQELAGRADV
mmetsp:Transcript_87026/g.219071  ORF Transcript_87026/g.219071 Transcript_87026/m.219071 type:complete len:244 (+) Transcript_87026:222-953(+)